MAHLFGNDARILVFGLGLVSALVLLGAGLGASGGIARIAAWLSLSVSASHTLGSEYFGAWGANPMHHFLVFMFVGTFVGALFSALRANRFRVQVERGAASSAREGVPEPAARCFSPAASCLWSVSLPVVMLRPGS